MRWQDRARRERIIVALDMEAPAALEMAAELRGSARWLKVGMTLFDGAGPSAVDALVGMGFDVFLDLKLHDIPHQVEGAARAVSRLGVGMLTVHASGGRRMVSAAADGAADSDVAILAVTVLTSLGASELDDLGVAESPANHVERLARLAMLGGADGIVCSPQEAAGMRSVLGPDALVVTPGVRPEWAAGDDQARTAGPREAFDAGASHIVIGRPVTHAASPSDAFERIADEAEE